MTRILHRSGAIPPIAIGGEGIYLHTANGQKMAGLSSIVSAQAIKDPSLVPKFSAFLKSYTDMLQ